MKTKKSIVTTILLFAVIILFGTSCSRGYGCPAKNFKTNQTTVQI